MSFAVATPGARTAVVVDLLVGSLPVFATFALQLPSGLAMPFRLVTLALAALAAWTWASTRQVSAPRTLTVVAVVGGCFGVFGAIGWVRFRSGDVDDAARVAFLWLLAAAVGVLATLRRTALWLLGGWVMAAAASACVGAWEVATGHHLPTNVPADYHAGAIPGWNIISAFFDNPNLYGYQCGVVLLLLPAVFVAARRGVRWLTLPFAGLVGYLLLWTEARLVLVAVLLGVALWAARERVARLVLAAVLALFAVASAVHVGFADRFWAEADNALVEFSQVGASSWVRAELARSAVWIAQQTGFLGVGPGGFGVWSVRADNPFRYGDLNDAHWGMLEVLTEYGLPTAIVGAAALVAACVVALKASRARPVWAVDRTLAFAGFLLAALLPVLSASHSTWLRQPLSAAHIATIVALLAWTETNARKDVREAAAGRTR